MHTHARQFLRLFCICTLGVFVVAQLFVGLSYALAALGRSRYLSVFTLAGEFEDLVLISLPTVLPASLLVGYLLFAWDVHRRRLFLWIHLAGRDPRWLQMPVLAVGVIASALLWWVNAAVAPNASFRAASSLARLEGDVEDLAARLAWDRDMIRGVRLGVGPVERGRFHGFGVFDSSDGAASVMVAETADVELTDDAAGPTGTPSAGSGARPSRAAEAGEAAGRFYQVNLHDGRLLQVARSADGTPALAANMTFEHFRLRQDARAVSRPDKRGFLTLKYYANAELPVLREQVRLLLSRGIVPGEGQMAKAKAVTALRAVRLQGAMLPAIFLALAIALVGRHLETGVRVRVAAVGCLCLLVLMPQQLVIESQTNRGFPPPWALLLAPVAEAALVFAFLGAWRLLAERRRPG